MMHIQVADLKRVSLEPGDVVVLQVPGDLSDKHAALLRENLSEAFPGHEIGILTGGAQLSVVRPVPGTAALDNSPEAVVQRPPAGVAPPAGLEQGEA
jgi:hypothetical protein